MKTPQDKSNILGKVKIILNRNSTEYSGSHMTGIFFLLIFMTGDVLLSLYDNLYSDAAAMFGIALLYTALWRLPHVFKKSSVIAQLSFLVTAAALSFMYKNDGYSGGSYFYLFPAAIGYLKGTIHCNNKIRFRVFFIIILLVAASLTVQYFVVPHPIDKGVGRFLFAYRLGVSLVFTTLLINHLLLSLQPVKKIPPGKAKFNEALFQSHNDAYIIYNKETLEVTDYNKRMAAMFDLPAELNLRGLYITQVMMRYLAEDSLNLDLLMNKIPDEWEGDAGFITHTKARFFTILKSFVFDEDESQYQLLSIRDITEIINSKEELKMYKEKMEKAATAKARFLSSMSHELRTPLNGIIGTSNLVLAESNLPDNIKNHMNILRYSSGHMLGIINDILDFSKIDAGKLELKKQRFNIKESLDNLTKSFADRYKIRDIELTCSYDPLLANIFVLSDEIKLSQVLANLLSNALKFTILGSVKLRAEIKEISESNAVIFFEVCDTGIGIAKGKQEEIFQHFVQVNEGALRRFDGTGLGLTISEKLVSVFGGKLEVESELDKGARFYFTLSFECAPVIHAGREESMLPEEIADIRGVRVLIVEDNEINAGILRSFLLKWQLRLKEARNGVHALELLKYHKFDLILMDLEMPEMNGYMTCKKIRETNDKIPIIAFTAALLEDMNLLITEDGFNDYVLKPFHPSDLKKKIEFYAPHRKIEYI